MLTLPGRRFCAVPNCLIVVTLNCALAAAQSKAIPRSIQLSQQVQAVVDSPVERKASMEDLSSLSIASSRFRTEIPRVGEKDIAPAYTRELVRVQWRGGDPINLYIVLPKGVARPPAVLYLYGYPAETDRFQNEDFCKLVTKNGVAAVSFVSALTGQRYHDRPMRQWFVSELREALVKSTHDVQMILNYLASRGDLDINRIAMFGEGSGATIAALAAKVDLRIRAVDLLDPWGDWPDWMANSRLVPEAERAGLLQPEFLHTLTSLDLVDLLPRLKIPVRLEYLNPHGLTPLLARERIAAAVPRQAQVVPTETGVAEYRATLGRKFLDWIQEQARQPSRTSPKFPFAGTAERN